MENCCHNHLTQIPPISSPAKCPKCNRIWHVEEYAWICKAAEMDKLDKFELLREHFERYNSAMTNQRNAALRMRNAQSALDILFSHGIDTENAVIEAANALKRRGRNSEKIRSFSTISTTAFDAIQKLI